MFGIVHPLNIPRYFLRLFRRTGSVLQVLLLKIKY